MDISDYTLVAISSALVLSSATIIIIVNFRRMCQCCIQKEAKIDTVVNPVNEWK